MSKDPNCHEEELHLFDDDFDIDDEDIIFDGDEVNSISDQDETPMNLLKFLNLYN